MHNRKRRTLSVDDYVQGVRQGNRAMLARTITLVESHAAQHRQTAHDVVHKLLPYTGRSVRIGITGVPGAGKSTLIEHFGHMLCEKGHQVAVLAVDPTSSITRGSILGDKTRMERLSRHPNAFIRPSPSGGALGGVTQKSRETLLVCEAAGFDIIIVETVGVGQSEIDVRSMVDFFLLLVLTGAGDELQGMKKGVMELADAIYINKADGPNKKRAEAARADYNHMLHFLKPATDGWETKAHTCSALTGSGLEDMWHLIRRFQEQTEESGVFQTRRRRQNLSWMERIIEERLKVQFYEQPDVSKALAGIEEEVATGHTSAAAGAEKLLTLFGASSGSVSKGGERTNE